MTLGSRSPPDRHRSYQSGTASRSLPADRTARRRLRSSFRLVAVVSAAALRTAARNCRRPAPRDRRPSRACFGEEAAAPSGPSSSMHGAIAAVPTAAGLPVAPSVVWDVIRRITSETAGALEPRSRRVCIVGAAPVSRFDQADSHPRVPPSREACSLRSGAEVSTRAPARRPEQGRSGLALGRSHLGQSERRDATPSPRRLHGCRSDQLPASGEMREGRRPRCRDLHSCQRG
jgi:hypothetical protein